jgi:hypothetical protein
MVVSKTLGGEEEAPYWRSTAGNRRVLIVDNSEERLHGLKLVVWRLPLDQLDDSTAKTPNVGGCGCTRELNDLWRHPVRCPNDTRLVQARLLRSHAKVCQLDESLFCGQDVRTLDVPVYDTLLVEVEKTVESLGHVERDEVFWELAEVLADAVQRAVLAVSVDVSPCSKTS